MAGAVDALGWQACAPDGWIGLGLGVGALLLAMEGDFSATWVGALLAFAAPLCWSLGSYASPSSRCPHRPWRRRPVVCGWGDGAGGGAVRGARARCRRSAPKSWAAWLLLVFGGTMVALNAYLWLLQTPRPLAAAIRFVNPAVALLVGVALGVKLLTGWVFAALPLIAGALGCILYRPMVLLGWWQRRVLPPAGCLGAHGLPGEQG